MELLSSTEPSRPSPAPSGKPFQQPPPIRSARSVDDSELLQLQLENSDLRTRLDEAISRTDESKSDLLRLLDEQTSQTNLLQSKCDELHRGLVEIDRERKALRRSADDARSEAAREVAQARGECDRRIAKTEGHLKVRENEVESLAERAREQERRIKDVVEGRNQLQSKVQQLEGELEELIGIVQSERENKGSLEGDYCRTVEMVKLREDELREEKLLGEGLERQLEEAHKKLEAEEGLRKSKEDQLNTALLGKEQEVIDLLKDQKLSKIEHKHAIQALHDDRESQKAQLIQELEEKETKVASLLHDLQLSKNELKHAVQTMQKKFDAQRDDLISEQQNMANLYQSEKAKVINDLQSQIDEKDAVICDLSSEMDRLRSNHAANVAELEEFTRQCKECTQAIERKYTESVRSISHLQRQLEELRSSNQIEQEELKATSHLLEKECGDLTEELGGTKVQLVDAKKKLSDVQTEYTTLSQEHVSLQRSHLELAEELDVTKVQVNDASEKLTSVQAQYVELQAEHEPLQQIHLEAAEELEGTKVQLAEVKNRFSYAQTQYKTLQSEHTMLQHDQMDLAKELDKTKVQLSERNEKVSSLQAQYAALKSDHKSLQNSYFGLEQRFSALEGQLDKMTVDHGVELSQKSSKISTVEDQLNEARSTSNKLRGQLRELNIQLKEDASACQREKHKLKQELENTCNDLLRKEDEVKDLCATLQAKAERHTAEVDSLRTNHEAQMVVFETRGANVVSDLEATIVGFERQLASCKLEHEQAIIKMQHDMSLEKESRERFLNEKERKMMAKELEHEQKLSKLQREMDSKTKTVTQEKEHIQRSLAESEKRGIDLEKRITSLTAYAKERKEEVKVVKSELAHVKNILENVTRKQEDAAAAIRNEMENASALHQGEMADLQHKADGVSAELTAVRERLAAEDNELERAKATLSERTDLLRDMVNQTSAYQGDYERERARSIQLDEAVKRYKKQLAEAREAAGRLENEIRDKDTHYFDAISNERQQRKAVESELDFSRKSMEDALRKSVKMEKDNLTLKDTVTRQEKYIIRLKDREKQNRDQSAMPSTTSASQKNLRVSKLVQPSPVRNAKERLMPRHSISPHASDNND